MIEYSVVGDIHIDENHFSELELIFTEIIALNSNTTIVFLGDIFHKNKPNPLEILFVLKWFKKFVSIYKEVVVIPNLFVKSEATVFRSDIALIII